MPNVARDCRIFQDTTFFLPLEFYLFIRGHVQLFFCHLLQQRPGVSSGWRNTPLASGAQGKVVEELVAWERREGTEILQ